MAHHRSGRGNEETPYVAPRIDMTASPLLLTEYSLSHEEASATVFLPEV